MMRCNYIYCLSVIKSKYAVNMKFKKLISLLKDSKEDWLRVNDDLCVHCFIGDYYIILCRYKRDDKFLIRVGVDDFEKQYNDILKEDYPQGTSEFNILLPIYERAKSSAKPAQYGMEVS